MAEATSYDLIVIGAGAGLNVAAAAADGLGWRVAVVEEGPLGGTCLNRGCIPSKIIINSAEVAETIRKSQKFGITAHIESVDFAAVTNRASEFVDHDAAEIEQGVNEHPRMHLFKTRGVFTGEKTLAVGEKTIRGEHVLIAAGARPTIPSIDGLDRVPYITSTEALRLTKQPTSLAVIGGGYIAAELGNFYGALGTGVTIIERGDTLIAREDADIAQTFTEVFSKKYRVLLGQTTERVEQAAAGVRLHLSGKDGKKQTIEAEQLLVAVGITPNSDTLAVNKTGVKTNARGYIEVNEYMETGVPGIWALGDIVGKAPFRHGADYEARHVIQNLQSSKAAVDYSVMPHAIFSSPQVAAVGLTEREARERKLPTELRVYRYNQTAMGKALEEEHGFVKYVLHAQTDTILGCHIIGPHASILIHEVVVAMRSAGAKGSAIRDAIHIHPALSEVVGWGL